jgi:hypothetical protein
MHKVRFSTKNIQENDPNYRLIMDRTEIFHSFRSAVDFVHSLRYHLSSREVLLGKPEIEVYA